MLESLKELFHYLYSPEGITEIIKTGGLVALIAIVFAETGLLVGFFLPGDSLLVTAGLLAAQVDKATGEPILNVWWVTVSLILAAIIGDQVGYWLGTKTGHAIFQREDSRFFKKKYALEAHEFYLRHGGKAIVLARFIPIFRTFVPFMAGVADMPYRNFVGFNIFGGVLWVVSMVWIGYGLGQTPLANQLHKIIIVVVLVSVLPIVIGSYKRWRTGRTKKATASVT